MGQQQLLLVILVTIIIGLATVLGIILIENYKDESFKDMIRQDIMEAATVGQSYYRTPTGMGGGNSSFVGITMEKIQLDTSTVISKFSITETTQNYFKITADPKSNIDDFTAVVYSNRIEWE